eukprot:scaffold5674_cov35-Cyclotella_meneghiniana.AAC.2
MDVLLVPMMRMLGCILILMPPCTMRCQWANFGADRGRLSWFQEKGSCAAAVIAPPFDGRSAGHFNSFAAVALF